MQLGKCTVYIDPPDTENPYYPLNAESLLCACDADFEEENEKLVLKDCTEISEQLIARYFRSGALFSSDSARAVNLTLQRNPEKDSIVRFICAIPERRSGTTMSFTCYKGTHQNRLVHFVSG